ncbi:TetR/AcrR family transcriptional regulator [Kitasatospora kifunensis]|uniref:AcrR family transcriptional regulator n=1 Tax=Kitasatospora kifunensis TaxID=58351 RepID=A0A7W7VTC2_KITKI|nr:TetR/AcrR family transcriptional regulator [Kitasatospora kifunensis]MBB4921300.1 AcrR family transcriptional regulator [Kitasatospora kifunensis]
MTPEPNPVRRSARSHRAILDATFDLAVRNGYSKLTIEAIAAAAGVGKPTIYRWWPSKGVLALESINERMGTATDFPDTGDVAADLASQIDNVVRLFCSDVGAVFKGVIAEAQGDPQVAAAVREAITEPRTRQCQARLERAVAAGQLRADIPTRMMVEQLYGPIYYRFLLGTEPLADYDAHTMVERALEGLRPRL